MDTQTPQNTAHSICPNTEGMSGACLRAFVDYAAMPVPRSLERLWQRYRHGSETGSHAAKTEGDPQLPPPTRRLSSLRDWSVKYGWQARVTDYDQQIAQYVTTLEAERRAKELEEMRAERVKLARMAYTRGADILSNKKTKIGAYAAVQMMDMGLKHARLDLGDVTERVEQSGDIYIRRIIGVPDDAI